MALHGVHERVQQGARFVRRLSALDDAAGIDADLKNGSGRPSTNFECGAFNLQMPGRTRVKSRGPRWPQPSMPGPFRQVYLDVKGEQSIEQLRLAIKMMLAEPAARKFFAAVLE